MFLASDPITELPRLGVGVLYNASLCRFVETDLDSLDFVEIIPDIFRIDRGLRQMPRFVPLETVPKLLDRFAERKPVIAHSTGLSIGSAGPFDAEYVAELARWQRRYRFPWHSEHLSFFRLLGEDLPDRHTALALPVPYDADVLDLVVDRIRQVQSAVPVPFLLENNVYFTAIPDQDMTEPEFLNALTAKTGCGLLLDLHNLYTNARNHRFGSLEFLAALDLTRVVEIHVAGGNEVDGIYTDFACWSLPR